MWLLPICCMHHDKNLLHQLLTDSSTCKIPKLLRRQKRVESRKYMKHYIHLAKEKALSSSSSSPCLFPSEGNSCLKGQSVEVETTKDVAGTESKRYRKHEVWKPMSLLLAPPHYNPTVRQIKQFNQPLCKCHFQCSLA